MLLLPASVALRTINSVSWERGMGEGEYEFYV